MQQAAGNDGDGQAPTTSIPDSTWLRRLAFKIRKRGFVVNNGTSMLISNCFGVWSLRHRRYIRKTRFLRFSSLKDMAVPVERRYASLRKLGMHSWPEYDEQVAFLRSRLVDIYWDAAPASYRKVVIDYFHGVRRWQRLEMWGLRLIIAPIYAAMFAIMCYFMVIVACYGGLGTSFWSIVFIFAFWVYMFQMPMWRLILFHKRDVSALRMFELLHEEDDV